MRHRQYTEEDSAMLEQLNEAVRAACDARRKWLDDNMAKYSDLQVGDTVYNIEKGHPVGVVIAICRWHRDDIRYDDSLSSYVEFEEGVIGRDDERRCRIIRNTSSERGLGTKEQAIRHAEFRMSRLVGKQ